jgi:hypothetical protein
MYKFFSKIIYYKNIFIIYRMSIYKKINHSESIIPNNIKKNISMINIFNAVEKGIPTIKLKIDSQNKSYLHNTIVNRIKINNTRRKGVMVIDLEPIELLNNSNFLKYVYHRECKIFQVR